MKLDEVKKVCHDVGHPANQPPAPELPGLWHRPWWLVVVNPRRQPPQPKMFFTYMTEAEAEAVRVKKQKEADKQAENETRIRKAAAANADEPDPGEWQAFRYFVIERPERGEL